jgi:CrcB protein
MTDPGLWLAVAAGGASGAILRATVYRLLERIGPGPEADAGVWTRFGMAWATLIVNTSGSFALGAILGALPAPRGGLPDPLFAFAATGFCGATTTFATLCADAFSLARTRGRAHVVVALVANVVLSITALSLGLALTR